MNVIRCSEYKIHNTEEKITERPGKDVHTFEELNSDEHNNPAEFCNEQELYYVGDEIFI